MVDSQKVIKYVAIGTAIAATGAILWWLSAEEETEKLDFKEFTLAKLIEFYKEIELEFCCIYARNYAMMLELKEKGDWVEDVLMEIKTSIDNEKDAKEKDCIASFCIKCSPNVCKPSKCKGKKGISAAMLEKWHEHYMNKTDFYD